MAEVQTSEVKFGLSAAADIFPIGIIQYLNKNTVYKSKSTQLGQMRAEGASTKQSSQQYCVNARICS